jgi:hypothetical protein
MSKSSSTLTLSVLKRRMDFTIAGLVVSSNQDAEHHG